MIRYAEMTAGTARKFYQVEVEGSSWTARWGRIGTAGQSKTTPCYSEHGARMEAEEQFRSKLKKGYVERTAMESLAATLDYDKEVPAVLTPELLGTPEDARHVVETACAKLNRIIADRPTVTRGADMLDKQAKAVMESLTNALSKLGAPYVATLDRISATLRRHRVYA